MRISDWSSDVFSSDLLVGAALVFLDGRLADAAGRAGDQADLVVESVHGEFPCGCTWIMARVGAGGHCLFVRCRAWRGLGRASLGNECVSKCRSRWSP